MKRFLIIFIMLVSILINAQSTSRKTDIMLTVEATESGATGCSIASGFDLVLVED